MELVVALGLLVIWTIFSIVYVNRFKKYQFDNPLKKMLFGITNIFLILFHQFFLLLVYWELR